ncbi:hypothetical protein HN51_017988 [Arachis hypogaea]
MKGFVLYIAKSRRERRFKWPYIRFKWPYIIVHSVPIHLSLKDSCHPFNLPTLHFFQNGKKADELIGADVARLNYITEKLFNISRSSAILFCMLLLIGYIVVSTCFPVNSLSYGLLTYLETSSMHYWSYWFNFDNIAHLLKLRQGSFKGSLFIKQKLDRLLLTLEASSVLKSYCYLPQPSTFRSSGLGYEWGHGNLTNCVFSVPGRTEFGFQRWEWLMVDEVQNDQTATA